MRLALHVGFFLARATQRVKFDRVAGAREVETRATTFSRLVKQMQSQSFTNRS